MFRLFSRNMKLSHETEKPGICPPDLSFPVYFDNSAFNFLFHNLSVVSQLKYELYLRSFAQFTVYMDLGSVKHGSVFYD